jgi:hypothetical protein
MNGRDALLMPLGAVARGPARFLLRIMGLFFGMLALGAILSVGFAGVGHALLYVWVAGAGLFVVRAVRQKLG